MIKPPFTLLIIKDSHHPVTIRVTTGLLLLLVLFPIFSLLAGAGMVYYWGSNIHVVTATSTDVTSRYNTNQYYPEYPDSLMVHIGDQNTIDITFLPVTTTDERSLFFWLMINSRQQNPKSRVILPRNPVYDGYPVDYRNGFEHTITDPTEITIPSQLLLHDVDIDDIRILAYTDNGTIHFDQTFTFNKPAIR